MRRAAAALLLLLIATTLNAADAQLAERVRAEFLFSWHAYEQYAWGHDELRPLSKTPRDWYGQSLLITPVDSLDTLILLGFDCSLFAAVTEQNQIELFHLLIEGIAALRGGIDAHHVSIGR